MLFSSPAVGFKVALLFRGNLEVISCLEYLLKIMLGISFLESILSLWCFTSADIVSFFFKASLKSSEKQLFRDDSSA